MNQLTGMTITDHSDYLSIKFQLLTKLSPTLKLYIHPYLLVLKDENQLCNKKQPLILNV